MVSVIGIDIGVQRTGINDDGYDRTSLARMSSMRSEISSRPLWPDAAASD